MKISRILMAWFGAACAVLLPVSNAAAFTVGRNVNDGREPADKVVIFEKGKPSEHLVLESGPNCKTALTPDGALESKIDGSDAVKVMIRWKAAGNLPETIDTTKYSYLVLTCRLEGCIKTTQPNGKVTEQRPDNLWLGPSLFNDKGEPVGSANMADVAADQKTPAQTVTLRFPMVLFTFWGKDASHVQAIGFTWTKSRPTSVRDFKLVIDKISFAD